MIKSEFERAIKGRRVYVAVAGTEFSVPTTREAVLELFEFVGGDVTLSYHRTYDEVHVAVG